MVKRLGGCGTNEQEVSAFSEQKERDILKITAIRGDKKAFSAKTQTYSRFHLFMPKGSIIGLHGPDILLKCV